MKFGSRGAFEIGERVGRYTIVEEIGTGGMATVYRARLEAHAGVERRVAIKAIHAHLAEEERFAEMFLDEARITARIHHANVCSVLDFGVHRRDENDRGVPYLVMEMLDGWPLHRIARTPKPRLLPRLALRIIADAARGLHAAHVLVGDDGQPLGIVHRDVSPQNIVVLFDGTTKIVDFGVARARGKLVTTRTGEVRGKMSYMSPEQLRGAIVDRRTDVWSLGVTLWEALTQQRLFAGSSEGETVMKILEDRIAPPSTLDPAIPAAFDAVVMKALERDPAKRLASCGELSESLEDLLIEARQRASVSDVSRFLAECVRTGGKPVEGTPVKAIRAATDSAPPPELTDDSRAATLIDATPSPLEPAPPEHLPRPSTLEATHRLRLPPRAAGLAAIVTIALIALAWIAWPSAGVGTTPVASPSSVALASRGTTPPAPSTPPPSIVPAAPPASILAPATEAPIPPRSIAVSVGRSVPTHRPAPAARAHGSGTLTVFPNPAAAHVRVGARDLGATPVQRQTLAAGHYDLVIEPRDGSPSYHVQATIEDGSDTLCNGTAPHVACRVR